MRDSPSALAFSSPEKRRVLAELAAKRSVIRSKFKKAYADRTKLERESKEIFKPILKSIDNLSPKKKKDGKTPIKKEEVKNERRLAHNALDLAHPSTSAQASSSRVGFQLTPARSQQSTSRSAPLLAMPSDDDDDNDDVDDDEMFQTAQFGEDRVPTSTPKKTIAITKANKRKLVYDKSTRKGDLKRPRVTKSKNSPVVSLGTSARTTRSQARKSAININQEKYNYEVVADYQDIKNYLKPLSPHAPVNVKQISIGFPIVNPKIIKVRWEHVPKYARDAWTQKREYIYDMYRKSMDKREKAQVEAMEVDTTPRRGRDLKRRSVRFTPYAEPEKKQRPDEPDPDNMEYASDEDVIIDGSGMNPFDFNFIPYNVKNRVVYEYFDDPNELCERLRLLISSRMAGNSNHMQEINSIVEELRELKCIA